MANVRLFFNTLNHINPLKYIGYDNNHLHEY
jgi:hypothetical protein